MVQQVTHNSSELLLGKERYIQMNAQEKEEYWFNVFKRGFANTNITLTQVEFLDLIPDELKENPTHKQGEAK